ncbi:PaaI family thioesterase [Streptomyces sp. NPDC015232]|uniref:PaaI family thioesterase n=1 Tax=unclassified Streptomyces TaxID=2593676 RepID=UPI0036F915F3
MTRMPAELDLDLARKVLDAQPFSRLLGARVTAFGDGAATLELDLREEHRQQNGYVHGGVLSYAADNALTFAAGAALGPAVLTAGFSIQYVRPAVGAVLRARASVVHAGRRQAVVRCEVFCVDAGDTEDTGDTGDTGDTETLVAVAQGTVLNSA